MNALMVNSNAVGFLGRVKRSEPYALAVDLDLSAETAPVLCDAEKPGRTMFRGTLPILKINCVRYVAEIGPSVVGWNPVFVVNIVDRPLPGDPKPNQAMGLEVPAVNVDLYAAIGADVAGNGAGRLSTARGLAGKKAGFWIVVKQLTKALRCQFVHSKPHQGIPRMLAMVGMSHRFACLLGQRAHSI